MARWKAARHEFAIDVYNDGMRLRLLAAGVVLGTMLMAAGCSVQQPQEQQMGTLEEYQNYGPWNDPYAYGYGYGYDPFSPFWYTRYPYYYPYYYFPIYPGPWYGPPAPRPRPIGPPIRPRPGGGHPIGPHRSGFRSGAPIRAR